MDAASGDGSRTPKSATIKACGKTLKTASTPVARHGARMATASACRVTMPSISGTESYNRPARARCGALDGIEMGTCGWLSFSGPHSLGATQKTVRNTTTVPVVARDQAAGYAEGKGVH